MNPELTFFQSVIETTYRFSDGSCTKETTAYSGTRTQEHSFVHLNTSNDFSQLQIDDTNLTKTADRFQNLTKRYYLQAKAAGVHLKSFLKLHNEYITINSSVSDYRNFFYCRIIVSKTATPLYFEFEVHSDPDIFEHDFTYYYNRLFKQIVSLSFEPKKSIRQTLPIIFAPQSTGYFVHEIVGHLLETDTSDSYKNLNGIMQQLLVTDSIQSVEHFLGLSNYDDNGVMIRPLVLINNGTLCNTISIEENQSLNHELYGMARRQSYQYPALARMRNTFVSPIGTQGEQEILNNYSKAYYVYQIFNGCCHPKLLKYSLSGIACMVYNGELDSSIIPITINGSIPSSLRNISKIASNFELTTSGCVKGDQIVRVCMGGPTIAIEDDELYVDS